MLRGVLAVAAILTAVTAVLSAISPALAAEISGEEARHIVVGKLFNYTCFEGTRGAGRVFADGSVIGTIQLQGDGPMHRAFLPAGTLKVKNGSVCATLRGLPIEPCFRLERFDTKHFRGSIYGLGFAYCDFFEKTPRMGIAERAQHREAPMTLRPSLASDVHQ
jgi:hypothetical protein